tara:strand:- start:324 stop:464 length:141 start_codon:yes stop_codon:yes gene_type:complete
MISTTKTKLKSVLITEKAHRQLAAHARKQGKKLQAVADAAIKQYFK